MPLDRSAPGARSTDPMEPAGLEPATSWTLTSFLIVVMLMLAVLSALRNPLGG